MEADEVRGSPPSTPSQVRTNPLLSIVFRTFLGFVLLLAFTIPLALDLPARKVGWLLLTAWLTTTALLAGLSRTLPLDDDEADA